MKRLVLFSILLIFAVSLNAQDNKQLPIKKDSVIYCDIIGITRGYSNKTSIRIDFGKFQSILENSILKDSNGKPIEFNSTIDALNYMTKLNWEFVQEFGQATVNESIYHFLLKKSTK
jgi:hypothetical protein